MRRILAAIAAVILVASMLPATAAAYAGWYTDLGYVNGIRTWKDPSCGTIHDDFKAKFFTDTFYGGWAIVFCSDESDLCTVPGPDFPDLCRIGINGDKVNDRFSSVDYNRGCVIIFEDIGYDGAARYVYQDDPSFVGDGWNDRVSSIAGYPGC